MDSEVQKLVFNLMLDMRKEELEPIGRARLIQNYLDDNSLTGRQLALQIGVPHSTLQDWLLWNKVTKDQYDDYIRQGYDQKDIYRSLRGGSLGGKVKAIDQALQNCISKLEIFKLMPPYSRGTKILIEKLKRILAVIERQVR
jgi:hypothetical protein